MEKLLIVDDEEIELDGMAELIDWPSYGYELVGTTINGKRGLALIQEKQPDIVITHAVRDTALYLEALR